MQETKFIIKEGSVRVDLVGGTLDIEPINLILRNSVTLNLATDLKAKVTLRQNDSSDLVIHSLDYQKSYHFKEEEITEQNLFSSSYFGEMTFILQILYLFNITSGLTIELSSGAPPGSGLGGSSAMGVTLYQALCELIGQEIRPFEVVQKVKSIEARILNQGMPGFQDYFPALIGGILAIKGIEGEILVEQLYHEELKNFLQDHVTLIYSGQSRQSGINNWEVYKSFFDGDAKVKAGLEKIAQISQETLSSLKNQDWQRVLTLVAQEGEEREKLFPGIKTEKIKNFHEDLRQDKELLGLKMCGAGGGGCFLILHHHLDFTKLQDLVDRYEMKILPLRIGPPLLNLDMTRRLNR